MTDLRFGTFDGTVRLIMMYERLNNTTTSVQFLWQQQLSPLASTLGFVEPASLYWMEE